MLRVVVAALSTSGALARWGDPDAIKEMAARELDRRHNLAELHKKGSERRQPHTTLARTPRVPGDDPKNRVPSRVLKSTGDKKERSSGKQKHKGKRGRDEDHHTAKEDVTRDERDRDEREVTIITQAGMKNRYGSHIDWTKNQLKNMQLGAAKPARATPMAATAAATAGQQSGAASGAKSGKSEDGTPVTLLAHTSDSRPPPPPRPSPSSSGKSDPSYQYYTEPLTEPWSDFEGGKSGKATGDAGKSGKSTGRQICNKRLGIAFEKLVALSPDDSGPFGVVEDPADVTELCYFTPEDFNLGCPFIYVPDLGFLQGADEYQAFFDEEAGAAFHSLVLYCECFQGLELGCAAKIPHGPPGTVTADVTVNGYSEFIPSGTPADRADYCEMVGVWNGDFDAAIERDLTEDVAECGCYFIGQAREMVRQCPGVDLGAFFGFDDPTAAPTTPAPTTDMPTTTAPTADTTAPTPAMPEALFYESFERGPFPADPWSVSNTAPPASRRLQAEGVVDWARTQEEAYTGVYALQTPDLANDDVAQIQANVELVTATTVEESALTFSLLSRVNFPADALVFFVDGEDYGTVTTPTVGWETFEIDLAPGSHNVTWVYVYNPLDAADDLPEAGRAFLDEVYLAPRSSPVPTAVPTRAPTTSFPTPFPTTSSTPPDPPTTLPSTTVPPLSDLPTTLPSTTVPPDEPGPTSAPTYAPSGSTRPTEAPTES